MPFVGIRARGVLGAVSATLVVPAALAIGLSAAALSGGLRGLGDISQAIVGPPGPATARPLGLRANGDPSVRGSSAATGLSVAGGGTGAAGVALPFVPRASSTTGAGSGGPSRGTGGDGGGGGGGTSGSGSGTTTGIGTGTGTSGSSTGSVIPVTGSGTGAGTTSTGTTTSSGTTAGTTGSSTSSGGGTGSGGPDLSAPLPASTPLAPATSPQSRPVNPVRAVGDTVANAVGNVLPGPLGTVGSDAVSTVIDLLAPKA